MKLCSYDRIKKFVPLFFQEIIEMDAIYRVDGEMVDELLLAVDVVKANRYIMSADEKTVTELEHFLRIETDNSSTLDDRKLLVISHFIGLGKISGTVIKGVVKSLSNADSKVTFYPVDEAGNNRLDIDILRPETGYRLENIVKVLSKRIPSHIWYNISVYHEKKSDIFVGSAFQSWTKTTITLPGFDSASVNWLVDEMGNVLADENGAILLD